MKPQQALVDAVRERVRATASETGRETLSPRVLDALRAVPRDFFVPPHLRDAAWDDAALPIGRGQTISQPFVVALTTELAEIGPDDRVLEVGTGCGYQTAVLARLARHVYSVELEPAFAAAAAERLAKLGHANVTVRQGDGFAGWPAHAPYDAIVSSVASEEAPEALVSELARGGRLVLPLGRDRWTQRLVVVSKDEAGALTRRETVRVSGVPIRRSLA